MELQRLSTSGVSCTQFSEELHAQAPAAAPPAGLDGHGRGPALRPVQLRLFGAGLLQAL